MKILIIISALLLHTGHCHAQGDTVTIDTDATVQKEMAEQEVALIYILKCPNRGKLRYDPKVVNEHSLSYYLDTLQCESKREVLRDPGKRNSFVNVMDRVVTIADKGMDVVEKIIGFIFPERKKEKEESSEP